MASRREIVKAAINHQPTERVPHLIHATGEMHDKLLAEGVTDNVEDYFDADVKCITPPWWDWHDLPGDWTGMMPPSSPQRVHGMGSYEDFAEQVRACRENDDKYILATIWGSHFEKANFARGIENFLADMGGDRKFAQGLLDDIIRRNMVMLENILSMEEIDGVLLGSDWGTQRGLLMSPAMWDDMIRPGEQREYDLVHSFGKDVWIHSCGQVRELIPRLIEMGVDVLNPIQPECMDIFQLKRDFGQDITFWGGVGTQATLPYGTPDEVRAEAREVKRVMSEGGGYIFAGGQAMQDDVPLENLRALLEVAREPLAASAASE
jgi:uroporphyrinogen decarboxylase